MNIGGGIGEQVFGKTERESGLPFWVIFSIVTDGPIWDSVRSGSGLSPEGCNFSRFLKSGFEWLNMFQLLYYDVVREDFTNDHLFKYGI